MIQLLKFTHSLRLNEPLTYTANVATNGKNNEKICLNIYGDKIKIVKDYKII